MSEGDENDKLDGEAPTTMSVDEALALAVRFHGEGRLIEARQVYEKILDHLPDQSDALHFLGVLSHQSGDSDAAVQLIRRSLELQPGNVSYHNNLGNVFEETGRTDEAAEAFRKAAALDPADPDVQNNLGVVLRRLGRLEEAAACYERTLAIDAGHPGAHYNLGNARRDQGRLDEAVRAYQRAVELQPAHVEAHRALGKVLEEQGAREAAVAAYRGAIAAQGDSADAQFDLGNALALQCSYEAAAEAYQKAIALNPDYLSAHNNLGSVLLSMRRLDEAAAAWRKVLELDPEHAVAQHMTMAMSGENVPARAADDYVVNLFDDFAAMFDTRLGALGYRAPQVVAETLTAEGIPPKGELEVLDGGCGTGLCGPFLRPWARRLVGVDLSSKMLEKARERGGYDELVATELTEYLRGHESAWDLIVSADTFVYFGDLGPLLGAAAGALRPGGLLVFTTESITDDTFAGEFSLNPHGRYSHTEAYVETVSQRAGLIGYSSSVVTLRQECGQPVLGRVCVARANSSS